MQAHLFSYPRLFLMAPPTADPAYLGTAFILCAFLAAILTGLGGIQSYFYFRDFQKDSLCIKCLIGAVWFLDGVHISLIWVSIHDTFVTHFNDPTTFQHSFPNTSLAFDTAFVAGTLSMALVLSFHSYRVKIVTPSRVLRYMCFFVTGTRNTALFLLSVLSCVSVAKRATTGDESPMFLSGWTGSLLLATVALSTLSDVNGTVLVASSLWMHREATITSTQYVVTKIISYTIQSGACRAIFMFSILISIILAPINIAWIVLVILGPGIYSNSLLTTLNARRNLSSSRSNMTLHSTGASTSHVAVDLESRQFNGSMTATSILDKGSRKLRLKESQLRSEKGQNENESTDRVDLKAGRPKLDMSMTSLSGPTPPVSLVNVIDLDLRERQPYEDEAALAQADALVDQIRGSPAVER